MQINLLGRPVIYNGEGNALTVPAKAWALFVALLTSSNHILYRDAAVVLLYRDAETDPGQASFRQLLRRTAGAVDTSVFGHDSRKVWAGEALHASNFGRALAVQGFESAAEMLAFASSFAPLLDEITFDEPGLQSWLERQRHDFAERARQLVLTGADLFPGPVATQSLLTMLRSMPDDAALTEGSVKALLADQRGAEASSISTRLYPSASPATPLRLVGRDGSGAPPGTRGPIGPTMPVTSVRTGVPRIVLLRPRSARPSSAANDNMEVIDGLVDDLTTELAASRELAVIAPFTAGHISLGHPSAAAVLESVEFVLDTRVRGTIGQTEALFTLRRTGSDEVVWSERLILTTEPQGEAYQAMLRSLLLSIIGSVEQAEVVEFRRAGRPTAYRHYLMGRYHLRALTLPDVRRARKWFTSATEIDPHFSRAYGWAAETHILEWVMMTGKEPERLQVAVRGAQKAIDLDPRDANGHRVLARAVLYRGDLDRSLEFFATAEALAPHFADTLADFADALMHYSRADAARGKIDLALALNPIPPDMYLWVAAGIDFFQGDFDGALEKLRRVREPEQVYRLMAASAAMLGDDKAARTYRDLALRIDPTFEIRTWIQRLPDRNDENLRFYVAALKRAGFH